MATARKAQWDPRDSPYIGCDWRGMPYLMHQAYPLEFVRQGDDSVLRMEFYDAERVIHMNAAAAPASTPYSLYGYTTGSWDDGTLVVRTTHIDAPYFDGGERLDYQLTVNDPETFTEEMEFTTYYIWRPEIRVEPFNCRD